MFLSDEFEIDQEGHILPKKGMEEVDIAFAKIYLELAPKKKKLPFQKKNTSGKDSQPKVLLDGSVQGRAKPGRMLAVMGPSGT